jgi:NitT/TauT family transport system ATP-binding protein
MTDNGADLALRMREVRKRFTLGRGEHVVALGPIDLDLQAGEFAAIVGPSGCGKSTLLRLGAGLLPTSAGSIERASEHASFVFQEPALLGWRTVAKNCALPLELSAVPRREWDQRVQGALELVKLADWGRAFPRQLSGGMKMRVSLARALVADASVVYFDEPFAAIDELTREELNDHLSDVWLQRRFAALFVTHNVHEAAYLAERVIVMSARPGVLLGEVRVPFAYPRTPELRTSPEFTDVVRDITQLLRHSSRGAAA